MALVLVLPLQTVLGSYDSEADSSYSWLRLPKAHLNLCQLKIFCTNVDPSPQWGTTLEHCSSGTVWNNSSVIWSRSGKFLSCLSSWWFHPSEEEELGILWVWFHQIAVHWSPQYWPIVVEQWSACCCCCVTSPLEGNWGQNKGKCCMTTLNRWHQTSDDSRQYKPTADNKW